MRLDAPAAEVTITPDEVRRMTLRAQGFLGATPWRATRLGVTAMLRRLGAVQLDTISVLARSHELVAYARLGPVPREQIEQAYWNPTRPAAFEYWAHAACVLPLEQWPYFAFRRRAFRARGVRWHQSHQETCEKVLARHPARRGQGRRPVVGLVRRQDRGGVAARRRRRGLRAADGVAPGVRPARAGPAQRAAGRGSV
jgi:uncharacterized protein YcaQ